MYPLDWLEERSGLVGGVKYFLFRKVPGDTNWFHTLGSATLTAFIVQLVTGVILAMYYKPSPAEAHSSVEHITNDVTLGWLVRGMHRWGASVFIILMFLHMGRVFLFGAYKYPRELNWIIGVLLLATGLFEGLTGLPAAVRPDRLLGDRRRDQHQRDGAVRRARSSRSLLRGGAEIGPDTLARFYSLHMLVVPGALIGADRPAPVPRRPARRLVAAVVERGRGPRARARAAAVARPASSSPARARACSRRPTE